MSHPLISIITPAYKGAAFLGEAIESVLKQTHRDFELIVVDDASPDHTADIVRGVDDARIKYIAHEQNRGSGVARHTGLHAASGEIIAFLDQDDLFHPEKLEAHVALLQQRPDVGFTYNGRFDLNYSSTTIRDIWRPPQTMTLADLVLWFPLSPSDVMLRKEWALQLNLLDNGLTWCGGEIYHFSRLFMSGCNFAGIDRALNYRRYHSGRTFRDLRGGCGSELLAQTMVFSDPRFPPEILALRDRAHKNVYMYWSFRAFSQGETEVGQDFLRHALQLEPSIVDGMPCELVAHLLINCIDDESQNHEALLKKVVAQLPPELPDLTNQRDWAVGQGYLLKGARAVMWGRPEDGCRHFEQAAQRGGRVDAYFLSALTNKLLNYQVEYGTEAAQGVLGELAVHLEKLGGRASIRWLEGMYSVNRAFEHDSRGEHASAQKMVVRAIAMNPRFLSNRGVLAVLGRSFTKRGSLSKTNYG